MLTECLNRTLDTLTYPTVVVRIRTVRDAAIRIGTLHCCVSVARDRYAARIYTAINIRVVRQYRYRNRRIFIRRRLIHIRYGGIINRIDR